jgi:hypothetical protein
MPAIFNALYKKILYVIYIIARVIQVLEVLSSSPELLDLLHKVDASYHTRLVEASPPYDDVLKYVPSIREQLKVGHALLYIQLPLE